MKEYDKLRVGYSALPTPCDQNLDTKLLSNEVSKLKRVKAADTAGLTAEHLLSSHLILTVILSWR